MSLGNGFKNQRGFTLIEMIVTILLVGMIAVFAGMGIPALMEGFMLTRQGHGLPFRRNTSSRSFTGVRRSIAPSTSEGRVISRRMSRPMARR